MIEEIHAKKLIQKVKFNSNWFYVDYNMNLYRGCHHGCIYCDSRSDCYHVENFDQVKVKKDTTTMLSKELLSKRKKGIVGIGAMSDTYNYYEKKLEVTKSALEIIRQTGFGVCIATKSPLIARDKHLIKQIADNYSAIVKITITCSDDALSKKIEPNVAVSSKRFAALKELSDEGIFCGVLLMPLLPFINDTPENIISIVKKSYESGAKFIYPMFGVTLRNNQRDYFYLKLDQEFPNLTNKYKRIYQDNYICNSPHVKELGRIFVKECKRYGLLYKMNDIINAYKPKELIVEQLSLDL